MMPLLLAHGLPSLPAVFLVLLDQCLLALPHILCSPAAYRCLAKSIGF